MTGIVEYDTGIPCPHCEINNLCQCQDPDCKIPGCDGTGYFCSSLLFAGGPCGYKSFMKEQMLIFQKAIWEDENMEIDRDLAWSLDMRVPPVRELRERLYPSA